MFELFDTISSYWNKITEFFHVIFEKLVDAWETTQLVTNFLPTWFIGIFVIAIVLIIVLRILGR